MRKRKRQWKRSDEGDLMRIERAMNGLVVYFNCH
jgi:hypothetical protein